MKRSLLCLAAAAALFGIAGPLSASELKSQPETPQHKTIKPQDALASGNVPSARRKPAEIVVVGSKSGNAGTGAPGANRTETIGISRTATSKSKGATGAKETITVHGPYNAASKRKGEIEIQSFGASAPRSR